MNVKNKAHEIIDIFFHAGAYDYKTCLEMAEIASKITKHLEWIDPATELPEHDRLVKVLYCNDTSGEKSYEYILGGGGKWSDAPEGLKIIGWRELV